MHTADEIASVILERHGSWTDAMSLQKLLYYVQAWHLAITDEPLFTERFKAWRDGPVVPQVWHSRKERATRSATTQDTSSVDLDDTTSNIIDLVLANYGSLSGEELSRLTHGEKPWLDARGDLPDEADCQEPISRDTMAAFYRSQRRLGGQTAADLAAGGVFVAAPGHRTRSFDLDELLRDLPGVDTADESQVDPWGGANLCPSLESHGARG